METTEKRKRRRYSAQEKKTLLARFATSGQTQAAFCRANDVMVPTFAQWRSRVEPAGAGDGRLVEVAVAARAPALLLEVNGCTLHVVEGMAPVWIGELVHALRACSG